MTDEERKQFINEYCRNVGNIKIKCDDCKFVEDCVDYGWDGCGKFTPKPNEPMTNEEYLRSLNTEQLAEWIFNILLICSRCGDESQSDKEKITKCPFGKIGCTKKDWVEWLKQPHATKE